MFFAFFLLLSFSTKILFEHFISSTTGLFLFFIKMVVFRPKTTHGQLLDNYRCNREQIWIIRIIDVMLHLNPTLILNDCRRGQLYR